jgi:hypothetical protein
VDPKTAQALVLLPDRDHLGCDYSRAFRPEADHLVDLYHLSADTCVEIDVSQDLAARRRQVVEAIRRASLDRPLDLVALLCHGWRTGVQLGFALPQVPALAAALATAGTVQLSVVLYACSTAQESGSPAGTAGEGGFADLLWDCLCRSVTREGSPATACHVDAHSCAGDCTSNPFVRRMQGAVIPQTGGDWLIEPHSELWDKWATALRDHHGSTLRFRFPLMTADQVRAELRG